MRTDDVTHPDLVEVLAALHAVHDGFLSGDTTAGDARMHPDVTLWDSAAEPLVLGRAGLAALRAARPAPAPDGVRVTGIAVHEPLLDVLGDTALLRHRLVVELGDGGVERVRVSSVWRRVEGRWLLLHHHEDVLAA